MSKVNKSWQAAGVNMPPDPLVNQDFHPYGGGEIHWFNMELVESLIRRVPSLM